MKDNAPKHAHPVTPAAPQKASPPRAPRVRGASTQAPATQDNSGQTRTPDHADGLDLQLPHERDESTNTDPPQPREVMRQAKADLDAGMVDTDLRATPGLDAQRRAELLRKQRV